MNLTHGFVEFDTHFTSEDGRGVWSEGLHLCILFFRDDGARPRECVAAPRETASS